MKRPEFDLSILKQVRIKKKFLIAAGVAGCLGLGALGTTLAANINLNRGDAVEFGQGVVQATACDSQITVTPISEFVNGIPGEFKFTGIDVSGLDTTDQSGNTSGCAGKLFEVKTYKENGDVNTPTITFVVRGDGTFVSRSGMMTTQNASTEASSGSLIFETATVRASDVYSMTFQSMKPTGCYQTDSSADGLTEQTAAPSGYWLAQNCSGYSSGTYWIKSNAMPNALQMYVDMTEEGGGYDFYFITTGPSATFSTDDNGGTPLGLDIVMPRSKYHWRAMMNAVRSHRPAGNFYDYFQTAYGVYRNIAGGSNGDYTNVAMNSVSAPDWRVKDGGRWWLSDNPYSEPNGDYTLYAYLSAVSITEGWNLEDFSFNDMGDGYSTGDYYLVSTNAKP